MTAYRSRPGVCVACHRYVLDLPAHFAFDPPLGCGVVALALSPDWWPYVDERHAANARRGAHGRHKAGQARAVRNYPSSKRGRDGAKRVAA